MALVGRGGVGESDLQGVGEHPAGGGVAVLGALHRVGSALVHAVAVRLSGTPQQLGHLVGVEFAHLVVLVPTAPTGDPWLAGPVSAAFRPGLVVGRGHVPDRTDAISFR
jgi:hypothetical protein